MADAIAFRGPDGLGEWHQGSVALAHRLFVTTPEAAAERQPLNDEGGGLALVFDGRLDNRDELREHFRRARVPLRDDTDPELVLRGYQLWADDLPARLLGDFAFAIWDQDRRRMFCARDPIGAKPFYYYCDRGNFIFASELVAFVAGRLIDLHPDEAFIAELLRDSIYGHTRSLLRGVQRLPGAHALVVTAETVRTFRYWSPENVPQLRYRRRTEYGEHARALLEQAVAARLRAAGPVACDLSGGLDSSSITVVAEHLRRTGHVATPLFASSVVFPGLDCDESRYIDDVIAQTGMESVRVKWSADQPAPDWRAEVQQTTELPSHPTIWTMAFARIAAAGARVQLLGIGGDDWLTGAESCLGDMLVHFRWREFGRQLRMAPVREHAARHLLRYAIHTLVPERVRARTRPWRGIPPGGVAWIRPQLLAQVDSERRRLELSRLRLPERAQREMAGYGFDGYAARARDILQLAQARFGIEPRYPFHDRRLIEFSLAIPGEELLTDGVVKSVLRNSMAGLLPESVRTRQDKAEFTANIVKRLRDCQSMFCHMRIAERGWVDEAAAGAMLQRALSGSTDPAFYREASALWAILALEAWDRVMSLP